MYDYARWKCQAAGRVNADGTITSPGGVFGCEISKNAGNGSYRVTLFKLPSGPAPVPSLGGIDQGQGQPIPSERLLAFVTPIGATPRLWSVDDVNDDVKDVEIASEAGALVDSEFIFNIGYFLPA